jgi:hypothetical protein
VLEFTKARRLLGASAEVGMARKKRTAIKPRRWEPPETIFPWTLDARDPDRDLWDGNHEFSVAAACPCCGGVITVRDTPRWGLCIADP